MTRQKNAQSKSNAREKLTAKIAQKIQNQEPNIVIALQWGKSFPPMEDVEAINRIPSKLSNHGVFGTNVLRPAAGPVVEGQQQPVLQPAAAGPVVEGQQQPVPNPPPPPPPPPVVFDKRFRKNDCLKYRLAFAQYNAKINKFTNPRTRDRDHQHLQWKWACEKHAPELNMDQSQYFEYGLEALEKLDKVVHRALRSSVGDCFGETGSRKFKPNSFFRRLHKRGIKPSIHVWDELREMKLPEDKETFSYQILKEILFYIDPTDADKYLDPPKLLAKVGKLGKTTHGVYDEKVAIVLV